MIIAQWMKIPLWYFKHGVWDWSISLSTGSMPSSHTSFVIATTTAIGYMEGIESSVFAISLVFSLITLHDAIKVRGESGKQAKVINEIVTDLHYVYGMLNIKDFNIKNQESKLKELIGHTSTEVMGGLVLGLFSAFIYLKLNNVI